MVTSAAQTLSHLFIFDFKNKYWFEKYLLIWKVFSNSKNSCRVSNDLRCQKILMIVYLLFMETWGNETWIEVLDLDILSCKESSKSSSWVDRVYFLWGFFARWNPCWLFSINDSNSNGHDNYLPKIMRE